MATGGVKHARYTASKIMSLMEEIDSKTELFDMIVFDGAICFPKVIVCKRTEHVGSLFLTKAYKEAPLELLKTWTSIVSFYVVLYFIFPFMTIIVTCFIFFCIAQEHFWLYTTC